MRRLARKSSARGFTILELLIASSVFTLVLILITTGVLQFSRQYYKGVIAGKTQGTARAIIDDISRAIQLNTGSVHTLTRIGGAQQGRTVGYCIGEVKRYSFVLNQQVSDSGPSPDHKGYHALISDETSGCSGAASALNAQSINNLPNTNARELLGQDMRLADFDISGSGDLWNIKVRVVYGDDDLICSPTAPQACSPTAPFPTGKTDLTCKSSAGAQFCAVSELSTTVQKRVN